MNILEKIIFFWKKPAIVIVSESDPKIIKKFISQILGPSFNAEKEVLITDSGEKVNPSPKEYLVLNFDNEKSRILKEKTRARVFTFGFQFGADIRAGDIIKNGGVNFKVSLKGSIVPFWLASNSDVTTGNDNEQIYAALSAISVGIILNLNLVEISQALKN